MTIQNSTNKLYFGDNLDILRQHVADEGVNLIYLNPALHLRRQRPQREQKRMICCRSGAIR